MQKFKLVFVLFWLAATAGSSQNLDAVRARFKEIENELDRAEVAMQIERLSKQILTVTLSSEVRTIAVVPIRNTDGKRSGLGEYLGYHLTRVLMNQEQLDILSPQRVSEDTCYSRRDDRFSPGKDAPALASSLSVQALLFGSTMIGTEKIIYKCDLYHAGQRKIIEGFSVPLPRTKELLAMERQSIQELYLALAERPKRDEKSPAEVPPAAQKPNSLELALQTIAEQLQATAETPQRFKVGLFEFVDLQGRVTQLGRHMAEELNTLLFAKGRFQMVERTLLEQTLQEHKLTQLGIIDITQAQQIGKVLGADAIVTGTLSDVGEEIKVNARMIHVGQGTVLAVASASIAETEQVAQMFKTVLK